MGKALCKACITKRVLAKLKPPLNRTDVLAAWSHGELLKTAPACSICRFLLEIVGDYVDDAGTVPSIFLMAAPFDLTYELTLYWRKNGLQRSVSIYLTSSCAKISPIYTKTVGRSVSRHVDLDWLSSCLDSCDFTPSDLDAAENSCKIRLIDVYRRCLVDATSTSRYVCLSYVWGRSAIPKLTTNNYARYSSEMGIQESDMADAQTIEDAIRLVSRLGFQYIWVDALCIMQDDPHDISTFIPNMGRIYSSATLTIVSDSQSASTGIPGISVTRSGPSPTLNAYGYALVASQVTLSEILTTSIWFSRGWTL
ncbi:heterokaryon incompatibility protein-domain-containing protein [Xylogone sp. PMI_703]|nr:heterokaryon incompatibility protein-domain-containing protein [Xylogone sp. PMI_703]